MTTKRVLVIAIAAVALTWVGAELRKVGEARAQEASCDVPGVTTELQTDAQGFVTAAGTPVCILRTQVVDGAPVKSPDGAHFLVAVRARGRVGPAPSQTHVQRDVELTFWDYQVRATGPVELSRSN